MTSAFAWLDFDDRARRQILDVVDLFREKGTLDDLGLGQIRDTFADRLFPGTSTIQTRAKYFLFLPWIYQRIEESRSVTNAGAKARSMQNELVKALKAGGVPEGEGVIGYSAGDALKRLPTAVYWYGMQRLGVRLINASIEGYHAQLDRRAHISLRTVLRAENDELIETAEHRWHPSLPLPPDNWLKSTTFDLTAEEASFLSERIQMSVPDTMLAACLVHSFANQSGAPFIWDLAGLQVLSPALRQVVRDAELFSLIMWGASLL